MGKLGIWYWNSSGSNVLTEEDEGVPVLESVGDRNVRTPKLRFGPPALIALKPYSSVQVNVDALGRNIVGDAANEPSLAVDPTNRNNIVIGWRQFDTVTNNFRQAGNAYSLNAGSSWVNRQVFTPGTFRSDPVLAVDSAGNFFYNSLQQTFFADVLLSTTSGQTWQLQGPATGGDKQWMTCDQTTGIGHGNLYESWSTAGNNYGGRQFSRSTNGGLSWMNPINIPGSPIWGTLDVDRNGALYIGGLASSNFAFLRSSNAQDPGQTPVFDRNVSVNLGGAIVSGSSINPAGLLGQMWIATDKSTGANAGNIYMLCSVGVNTQNPCQVNFVRSTDGGLTWSSPRTINDDALNAGASHWFGTLAVAPNGRIDVCWFDNRANPAVSNSALFTTSSYDGGITWLRNSQLTPYFNPNIGYPNQNKMGDYMGMVSDNQGANIVYAATFNGEEDIWFTRVPALNQSTNAVAISTIQGTYLGGAVSDVWTSDGNLYKNGSVNVPGLGDVSSTQADFVLPTTNVKSLEIKLNAATYLPMEGSVWLYNWRTQAYDYQQFFPFRGGTATNLSIKFNGPLTDYIDANRNVRCLARFLIPPGSQSQQFQAQIDLFQLLFG